MSLNIYELKSKCHCAVCCHVIGAVVTIASGPACGGGFDVMTTRDLLCAPDNSTFTSSLNILDRRVRLVGIDLFSADPCWPACCDQLQGLYSLSGKTSYRKISWSLEAARFGSKLFQSLWNLAGTSAAMLPRCLSNFRAIRPLQHPISRLRDFTRSYEKTSFRILRRGPACCDQLQ